MSNSSSSFPSIYSLNREKQQLEVLVDLKDMASIQGLALDKKENRLYFADYRFGLHVLDLRTKVITKLQNDTPHPLKAIDGLYFWKKSLIAIHNGTNPFRVVKYTLDSQGERVVSYEFVEKALPEMNEPTLGVVHKDNFYYIVNSPWGAYDRENNFLPAKADSPKVRMINLKVIE